MGSAYVMDDANVPVNAPPPTVNPHSVVLTPTHHYTLQSLLSLPYIGFLGSYAITRGGAGLF